MQSPNPDESRPTSMKSDPETNPQPEQPQVQDQPSSSKQEDIVYQKADDIPDEQLVKAEEQSVEETQLSPTYGDGVNLPPDIPEYPEDTPRAKRRWILWSALGILILAILAAGSAFAGYNSAIDERTRYQSTQVAGEASSQYVLAQQDIATGNYERARQRLEYIIQIDPNYPGVAEQLAFILTQQRITASPTLAPTPTLTPTPDYRTRDELFANAQNLLNGHDWSGAIDTLLQLRKINPDFMPVKVDGMLFVALRNRGIDKISQQHDLEGGNYDLSLAERFGPLDAEARNWRDWAEMYIRGASFWGVDWAQAVYYFAQVSAQGPNLMDASGWTATNRYMDALLGYGNWLAAKGEWCDAQIQFDTYMSLQADPEVEPTAVFAAEQCSSGAGPTETPPGGELTPTPGTPVPTETVQPQSTPYP